MHVAPVIWPLCAECPALLRQVDLTENERAFWDIIQRKILKKHILKLSSNGTSRRLIMHIFTLCALAIALALPTLAEARGGSSSASSGHSSSSSGHSSSSSGHSSSSSGHSSIGGGHFSGGGGHSSSGGGHRSSGSSGGGNQYIRQYTAPRLHGHTSPRRPAQAPLRPAQTGHSSYGRRCACSSGATCTEPSGKVYCITRGGKKRYFKRLR